MFDRPRVSVIIPVFNGARFLEQAVTSVFAQTWQNLELIVINDGSTDESREILEKYKGRAIIVDQPNRGVGIARNRGILQASGEFIAFLDQDDWWLPEKLGRQLEHLRDHDAGLVHTRTLCFDEENQAFCEGLDPEANPALYQGWCFQQLLLGNAICNSSVLVRRELFAQVGLCDPRILGNSVQDYDLWLRFARVTPFAFVDIPLTVFRLHPEQGTNNRRLMLREQIKVLSWRLPLLRGQEKKVLKRRLSHLAGLLGKFDLDFHDRASARRAFLQALLWRPSLENAMLVLVTFLPKKTIQGVRKIYSAWKGSTRDDTPHDGSIPEAYVTSSRSVVN